MSLKYILQTPFILCLALALTGCGKDGGGNDDPTDATDTTESEDVIDIYSDTGDASDMIDTMDGEEDADASLEEIPIEDWGTALNETLCEAVWECPNRQTLEFSVALFGRFESLEECRQMQPIPPAYGLWRAFEQQAFVADGTVEYDPLMAAECVAGIYTRYCDASVDERPEACEKVFSGTLATGESCSINEQCQEGLRCVTTSDCDGTCQPDTPTLCGGVECEEDQYCDTDVCVSKKAGGELCKSSSQCQDGFSCDGSEGTQICVEDLSRAGGDACESNDVCAPGYICANNVCARLYFAAEGESCSIMIGPLRVCEPGLTCQNIQMDQTGTCGPPLGAGASCTEFFECSADFYCGEPSPSDPEQCIGRKADGSACNSASECSSYYCSNAGTCEPPPYCTP